MGREETRQLAILLGVAIGIITAGQPRAQGGIPLGPPQPECREVIALSSTFQSDRASDTTDLVHELLQMPLNHLGMVVRQYDLAGPPPPLDPTRTRAVLTYFHGGEACPPWLWSWLARARDELHLRVIHFGDFGPLWSDSDRLAQWLLGFGLALDIGFLGAPLRVHAVFNGEQRCQYESRPVYNRVHHGPRNLSGANDVWVSTVDLEGLSAPRAPVLTGPFGGIALQPWAVRDGAVEGERRWYIDPFRFFADALDLRRVPAPDPCVVTGRRRFFLHVDGDGFESVSTVRPGAWSAQVMLDEVFDRYRLPVSVSVIVAGLTDDLRPAEPTPRMQLAKEIFARPYVEIASHSVLHPQHWRRTLTPKSPPHTVTWYPALANYTHSMVGEVTESIAFINAFLCPADRRCRLMFWSGLANPSEPALAAAGAAGCLNLNGGEYRWDALNNSVGYVSPWGKQLGDQFQVYCGAGNENLFDGYFTSMPGAFAHIDRTLENSGAERILKPADVYVHFYSAERPPRLRALQQLIQRWAFGGETAPCYASEYVRAVLAAQNRCRTTRTAAGWEFSGFDDCPTVRIDGETHLPDWSHSKGLLGCARRGSALYLHLAGADAEVAWAAPGTPDRPHLEFANCTVRGALLGADWIEVLFASTIAAQIGLAGFPAGAALLVDASGELSTGYADPDGRYALQLPANAQGRLRVRIR